MASETILSLREIRKSFDTTEVLKGIELDVGKGEFVTLLGSSGCGKTTLLRIIAGLERPDSGSVILDGRDITGEAPERRNVNTVFQSYALFPHLDVAGNIAYGLKIKKVPKDEIRRKVDAMLALVKLEGLGHRLPSQLSGGQRQRVALARALVNEPEILLLDEPLGALDLRLRKEMQAELKKIQQTVGTTFIYVTHDQEEALNMSSRIALMRQGSFEQIGSPSAIYHSPRTRFVAEFIGDTNILPVVIQGKNDEGFYDVFSDAGTLQAANNGEYARYEGVYLSVRPESVSWWVPEPASKRQPFELDGIVRDHHFTGSLSRLSIAIADGSIVTASAPNTCMLPPSGSAVKISWAPNSAVIVRDSAPGGTWFSRSGGI